MRGRERRKASPTTTYTTGAACRRCQATLRYIVSDQCVACGKAAATASSQKQMSLVVEFGTNIFIGRACKKCGGKERYIIGRRCVACIKATGKLRAHANLKQRAIDARRWRAANPESAKASCRRWFAKNPEARRAHDNARRARKRDAHGHYTRKDIDDIFRGQRGRCAYCRKPLGKKFHIDHIIALSRGGTNWPRNLQLTHQICNNRKHAKDPLVYAREIGLLL